MPYAVVPILVGLVFVQAAALSLWFARIGITILTGVSAVIRTVIPLTLAGIACVVMIRIVSVAVVGVLALLASRAVATGALTGRAMITFSLAGVVRIVMVGIVAVAVVRVRTTLACLVRRCALICAFAA